MPGYAHEHFGRLTGLSKKEIFLSLAREAWIPLKIGDVSAQGLVKDVRTTGISEVLSIRFDLLFEDGRCEKVAVPRYETAFSNGGQAYPLRTSRRN